MTQDPVSHLLQPENQLEIDLLLAPECRAGFFWGQPRPGHPEGLVLLHIREVLDNIDNMELTENDRKDLRIVAIVHDTFKVDQELLSHEGISVHHGHLAAHFLSQWAVSSRVKDIVYWHDEAFYCWKMAQMGMEKDALNRLYRLHNRLTTNWPFFNAFFQADTLTGDKDPSPLAWTNTCLPRLESQSLQLR